MICKRMRQSNKYKGKCNYISDGEKHIFGFSFFSGGLEDQSKSQDGEVCFVIQKTRLGSLAL